jgi:hypothetical protein
MIRLLGAADGYNTEASERLHIDYAKDAYQATNRKDYVKQMTTWLQRQETADQFSAYLDWRQQLTNTHNPEHDHQEGEDDETESIDAVAAAVVRSKAGASGSTQPNPTLPYRIAKSPSVRNATINDITTLHRAHYFLPALAKYLLSINPSRAAITPSSLDRFNLYKQISIPIGHLPGVPHGTID